MTEKILLDTDIGSDIDDAVCLAYLLSQPDCELLGITTVTGEAIERAGMASALCRVAGKRIPIFPGADEPLLVPQRQPHAQQKNALERWPHDASFPRGQAVPFLRDMIRAHPGEVTLLAIGPLTNIALLFHVDPELPALLKGLVLMCGVFSAHLSAFMTPEWNARVDPQATAMVFGNSALPLRAVGTDVTSQVTMDVQEVRARFCSSLLRPVLDFSEVWFASNDVLTFHDPLAAVTIFDPGVCQYARGEVEVGLSDPAQAGMTYWRPNARGRHTIATAVDAERFFGHYFTVCDSR